MLIEFLKSPILVDGRPVIINPRLNITGNHQLRLKMAYVQEDDEDVPVDIVVYNWTTPKLERLSIIISVDGKEMIRDIPFHIKITYDFLKSSWKLKGNFGSSVINQEIDQMLYLIMIFRKHILIHFQQNKTNKKQINQKQI